MKYKSFLVPLYMLLGDRKPKALSLLIENSTVSIKLNKLISEKANKELGE